MDDCEDCAKIRHNFQPIRIYFSSRKIIEFFVEVTDTIVTNRLFGIVHFPRRSREGKGKAMFFDSVSGKLERKGNRDKFMPVS